MASTSSWRERLRIWETEQGRAEGWDIEFDGRVVGRLDEPRQEEMFWTSYRVAATTEDPVWSALLVSEEFWRGDMSTQLVFRSRALGNLAEEPFSAAGGFVGPQRVAMRGLFIGCPPPAPWDRLLLKVRALWRRAKSRVRAAGR